MRLLSNMLHVVGNAKSQEKKENEWWQQIGPDVSPNMCLEEKVQGLLMGSSSF